MEQNNFRVAAYQALGYSEAQANHKVQMDQEDAGVLSDPDPSTDILGYEVVI